MRLTERKTDGQTAFSCMYNACSAVKTVRFRPVVTTTYRTLIGNPMLEVKPTSQRQPMSTGYGRNGFDLENFTLLISRKQRHG